MKTKLCIEDYKGNEVISVWEVDDKDEKVGKFPIVSFGKKKAEAVLKHSQEIQNYLEGKKND